jgi:hypothetical protein
MAIFVVRKAFPEAYTELCLSFSPFIVTCIVVAMVFRLFSRQCYMLSIWWNSRCIFKATSRQKRQIRR